MNAEKKAAKSVLVHARQRPGLTELKRTLCQIELHKRDGWAWRQQDEITVPRSFDRPGFNHTNQPVTGVSWYEAVDYANWLGERTGRPYRLPTEAEWERAARYTDGRTYPWGADWQDGVANTREVGLGRPCAVAIFPGDLSKDGLLDMGGNLNEWCQTRWDDGEGREYPLPYRSGDSREGLGGGSRVVRVLKGGSYMFNGTHWSRCAYRDWFDPYFRNNNIGFRMVLSPFITSEF